MQAHTVIIGIGGTSGSGKSALCREVQARLGPVQCAVLEMDAYYHDLRHLAPAEREARNFDDPAALDVELLLEQVALLRRGEAVRVPAYDFVTHTRVPPGQMLDAAPVLLVEGIFCLAGEELRRLLDWSVYLATPAGVCLERRLARDTRDRGRSDEQARLQYETTVRPAAERIVMPSARHASTIMPGTEPLDEICSRVIAEVWRLTSGRVGASRDVRAVVRQLSNCG